jgi:hypothetical protein
MPVLVSSFVLESSSLAKGFLKKLVASGCRPESLIQGFSSSGLGIAWASGAVSLPMSSDS